MITEVRDKIRIQEIVAGDPGPRIRELPFDPEKDITSEQRSIWENRKISALRDESSFINNVFWRNFTSMLILFPDSKGKLVTLPFAEMHERYKDSISLGQLRLIYPDKVTEPFIRNSGKKFEDYKDSLENRCRKYLNNEQVDSFNLTDEVFEIFLLFPEKHTELRAMDIIGETLASIDKTDWFRDPSFSISERKLVSKLLKPHDTVVTDEEWGGMKSLLDNRYVNNGWFMANAARMKLLTSEEIKVTSKGLQLVMPGDEPEKIKDFPLPELRKF